MASFNQPVKEEPTPNYTHASQGISPAQPNKAMGTLFAGLGDVLGGVVDVVDNENKEQIKKGVYEGVDAITGAQGGNAAVHQYPNTLWGPDGQSKTVSTGNPADIAQGLPGASQTLTVGPPNAQELENRVGKLAEASKNGTISDTYYYTQLESLTRQLRTRFPGYREEVDAMIHKVTGVTPANALRQSIQNDLTTQQRAVQAQADSDSKWIDSHRQYLPADVEQRQANGKPYNILELKHYAGLQQMQEQAISTQKSALELAKLNGTLTREQGVSTLTNHLNAVFNDTLIKGAEGGGLSQFMSQVQKLQQAGKPLTPEDQQTLRNQFAQLKLAYQSKMESVINETNPKTGNSYSSLIGDNNEVEKVRKNAMTRFDNIEQALNNGDFGLLNIQTNIAKAQQDDTAAKLMQDPNLRLIGGLSKINQQLPAILLNADPKLQGRVVDSLLTKFSNDNALGDGSFGNGLDKLKLHGQAQGGDYQKYVTAGAHGITDPDLDDKARINTARSIFVKDDGTLLSKFSEADRPRVFSMLASPQVTAQIAKLKDQDPELFKAYGQWVARNFATTTKGTLDTLSKETTNNINVGVQFDPKSGQFVLQAGPNAEGALFRRGADKHTKDMALLDAAGSPLRGAIDDMNKALVILKPVVDAAGGDIQKELQTFLKNSPLNQSKPNGVDALLKAVGGAAEAVADPQAHGAKDSTKAPPSPALSPEQNKSVDAAQKQPAAPTNTDTQKQYDDLNKKMQDPKLSNEQWDKLRQQRDALKTQGAVDPIAEKQKQDGGSLLKPVEDWLKSTPKNPLKGLIQLNNKQSDATPTGPEADGLPIQKAAYAEGGNSDLHYLQAAVRAGGKGDEAWANLQPEFASRIDQLIAAAPPELRDDLKIISGHRTTEHQAELYKASGGSGMVARPGHSFHERGEALDWNHGKDFENTPAGQWVHANAGKFGLYFPLDGVNTRIKEGWHMEMIGGGRQGGESRGFRHDQVDGADSDPVSVVTRAIIGNPSVEGTGKNPNSNAVGVGQFVDKTWLSEFKRQRPDAAGGLDDKQILALKRNPGIAAEITRGFTQFNAERLTNQKLPVTPANLYLMHFAGQGDAPKIIKAADNTPIERVVSPASIEANGFLRGKTVGEVKAWAEAKINDTSTKYGTKGGSSAGTSSRPVGGGSVEPMYDATKPDNTPDMNGVTAALQSVINPQNVNKQQSNVDQEVQDNVKREGTPVDAKKHEEALAQIVAAAKAGKINEVQATQMYKALVEGKTTRT